MDDSSDAYTKAAAIRQLCQEVYQVVGQLASEAGLTDDPQVQAVMDDLYEVSEGNPRQSVSLLPFTARISYGTGKPGRLESYMHSDSQTPNKGASLIRVRCETDFASRTEPFTAFCKKAAQYAYAITSLDRDNDWASLIGMFPSLEEDRLELEAVLKEKIEVERIVIAKL